MYFKSIADIEGLTLIEPDLYKDKRGENFEAYDTHTFLEYMNGSPTLLQQFKGKISPQHSQFFTYILSPNL